MQSLKSPSFLQIISAIFSSKKVKKMDNIFGNIQLVPVQGSLIIPSSNKKQSEVPVNLKQRRSLAPRHTFDIQQSKKRAQCLKSIQQVKNNIRQTVQKNSQLYARIVTLSPDFSLVLFQPLHYQNISYYNFTFQEQAKNLQQKLLIELDTLYEQNCLLEKQLNRIKFTNQNEQKQKQDSLHKDLDHYQFLRTVWKGQTHKASSGKQKCKITDMFNSCQESNSQDMLERLNSKVAKVRNNINLMLRQQQNQQNLKSIPTNLVQDQFIISSNKYQRLLKLYEQTAMKLQEQTNLNIRYQEKIQEIQQKLGNFSIQKSSLNQIKSLKEKITILEQKLEKNESQAIIKSQNMLSFEEQPFKYINEQNSNKVNINSNDLTLNFKRFNKIQAQKDEPIRKSLTSININQIKTDRVSLLKKTNKLNQSLNGSNTLRKSVSKQRPRRQNTLRNVKQKQNFLQIQQQDHTEINFPDITSSINLQNDLKVKFIRTSNRTKRQSLR